MAANYCTWQDAIEFLDPAVYDTPGATELQHLAGVVTSIFENEVRGRIEVPISEIDSPEAYAQAKQICAMRTAALYAKQQNQAEGHEKHQWLPDYLEEKANDLLALLVAPHKGPEDRIEPESPLVYLPSDGKTAADRPAALFGRDNITSGSTHW